MQIVRAPLVVALLASAFGLLFAFTASSRIVDVGAALFALATWIVPPLLLAGPRDRQPKGSLAKVGRVIGALSIAACLSVAGLTLAIVSLMFAQGGTWDWSALAAIAAFCLALVLFIAVGSRRSRPGQS